MSHEPGLQSKVCLSCGSGTLISSTEVTESWEWSKTSSKFFEPEDPGDLDLFDFAVWARNWIEAESGKFF